MTLTALGLLTVELQGLNGSYIGVDGSITSYGVAGGGIHAGYLVQSNVGAPDLASKFFVAVQQNLQAAALAPLFSSLSPAEVSDELEQQGVGHPQTLAAMIFAAAGR